ncbi:MAG: AI-2E family transporter [Thermosulfidibacteraceae bacterium]|jgi:predicted PurR-regulated permease PerM
MKRENFLFLVFISILITILTLSLFILVPFIKPILWAIFVSVGLWPLRNYTLKKLKSKTLTSLIITIIILIVFLAPISILATYTVSELITFMDNLQKENIPKQIIDLISSYFSILSKHPIFKTLEQFTPALVERINASINNLLLALSVHLKNLIIKTGSTMISFAIFLFALFFILKEGDYFFIAIKGSIPLEATEKERILKTIQETILAVIYGTLGTALIQSLASLITFLIFSIPYAYLLGFLSFFASFIPPFGTAYIWLPVSFYLLKTAGILKMVLFVLVCLVLISSLDNVVRPMIMKSRVSLPYIVLFFAFFGGIVQFGFIGIFIGPIVFALLTSIFKILREKYLESEKVID